jgi:hypothetical protein
VGYRNEKYPLKGERNAEEDDPTDCSHPGSGTLANLSVMGPERDTLPDPADQLFDLL